MSLLQNVSSTPQSDTRAADNPRSRRGRTDPPAPTGTETGTGGSLTRVTANFTPRAIAALEDVAARTGDSKTDILNRSVMVYQVFLELMERTDGALHVTFPDGTEERLRFLG
jgi:hypothetical protein